MVKWCIIWTRSLQHSQRAFKHRSDLQNHESHLQVMNFKNYIFLSWFYFAFRCYSISIFQAFLCHQKDFLSQPWFVWVFLTSESWEPHLKKTASGVWRKPPDVSCPTLALPSRQRCSSSTRDGRAGVRTELVSHLTDFFASTQITRCLCNWQGRVLKTCELECLCQKC